MTSPKVIFNCRFMHAFNRREANYTAKQKEGLKRKISRKFDYFSNEEKRVMNLFDYYTGNINKKHTMNLVIEDGNYATKEELEKRKKQFIKYAEKSNLWQGVISFNNDYLTKNISLRKLEKEMMKTILPRLFKKMGFKSKDKMAYNLSFHTDTDNLHIHFSFIEKSSNYICADKKLGYRRKGKLSQEEIDFMKNEVVLAVERENYLSPMITVTNNEIDKLKEYFNPKDKNFILYDKKDLLMEEKILRLGKLLYESRTNNFKRIKYNSIRDKEIKTLTKDIKKYLFNSKGELYDSYNSFKLCLDKINSYLKIVNKSNNITSINIDTSLSDYKEKYLDNYIMNAIINHANYFYKTKSKKYNCLKEDDLLREIILTEYKKNKSLTRYNILVNYLSSSLKNNKYKNKQNIINSIKHINDVFNETNKEFSKFFIVDEINKNN